MAINHTFVVPHPPLIIPEVGRGEQRKIQPTIDAYENVGKRIADIRPDTVVVVTPHSVMYGDYIHISPGTDAKGDFSRFGAPQVSIHKQYDTELVDVICDEAESEGLSAGTMGERDRRLDHGTLIPLWFIDRHYADYEIVRVSISGLGPVEHYRFGSMYQPGSAEAWSQHRAGGERGPVSQADGGRPVWLCKGRPGV